MVIAKFYDGREIFITGATGFLGKSLFEKLLRSCRGITKIYILIRAKKGKTSMERLNDLKKELLFDRLHRECPNAFEKVVPIIGDCQEIGLGISKEDLKLLENVSVVFHEAANVKFDNDLRNSLLMNTRGTFELVKIALNFKNIISFVHISTAYIHPKGKDIEEKLYKAPIEWRTAIKIAETYDMETLEALKLLFTDFAPNVYTFTKNLSEHIVEEYADRLPMTILRPAVVFTSYNDPEPGFCDNLNGPMGLLATTGLGLSQMAYCDPDLNLSLMPVDMITSLTITGAYVTGVEKLRMKNSPMTVRNFAPGELYKFSVAHSTKSLVKLFQENPLQYTVWAPASRMTTCFAWYMTWVFLVQIPMSLMYDILLVLLKKEPMLLKTTRRLVYNIKALSKFTTKYFNFSNDGMWELLDVMKEKDRDGTFYTFNPRELDFNLVFQGLLIGIKKHIFKEPVEATPSTKRRYKILFALNEIVKFILFAIVIKYLWNLVN